MLINAEDLDTSPPQWLADGLIPRVGVGFGFGPSFIGKSLVFGQELGLAVANENAGFFGRETVHGSVAYCLGEGLGDAGVRLKARLVREQQDRTARAARIAERDGPEAAAAWLAAQPPYTREWLKIRPSSFVVPAGHLGEPTKSLRQAANEIGQLPKLELVILDSAADFTGGLSLANDTSANRFMLGMKWLAAELDVLVLAIAHPNQQGRLPGSRLYASSDFVIAIEPEPESPDGTATATITSQKVKQGRLFDPFGYVIEPVSWFEPATDPETGAELPGEPPVLTTSVTVRLREDENAGNGGLRIPGSRPSRDLDLPQAVEIPPRPRKRNGIRPGGGFRVISRAEAADPERAELAARIITAQCPVCEEGTPGKGCNPGVPAERGKLMLGRQPLIVAHTDRAGAAVADGTVTEDEVLSRFGNGALVTESQTVPA